jgi:hypothetical protein
VSAHVPEPRARLASIVTYRGRPAIVRGLRYDLSAGIWEYDLEFSGERWERATVDESEIRTEADS